MNYLDAVLALLILLSGFAVILTSINSQSNVLENSLNSLSEKDSVLECATIIDSFFSNSANIFEREVDCSAENNKVISIGKKKKELFIITKVKKENNLVVRTNDHYT